MISALTFSKLRNSRAGFSTNKCFLSTHSLNFKLPVDDIVKLQLLTTR